MNRQQMAEAIMANRMSMLRLAVSIVQHRQDAEDAVSETVVRALRDAEKLRQADKVKSWLLTVTARCCYDLIRSRRREELTDDFTQWECSVFDRPTEGTVLQHIIQTPPKLRDVLTLYYYEGYTAKEIASILGISLSTVLMRMKRGRQSLEKIYQAEGDASL